MAQHLRHDLRVDPLPQQQRRRVPQVVEADGRQPGLPEQRRELALQAVVGAQGAASRVRKDEILVPPRWPGRRPLLGLPALPAA
jgi:hypothetical protein